MPRDPSAFLLFPFILSPYLRYRMSLSQLSTPKRCNLRRVEWAMSKISDGLKTPSVAPREYTEDRGLDRVGQRHLKPLCPSVSLLERGQ